MIETIVLDYLKEKMNIPVYMEHQKEDPDEFYLIEKTGSGGSNHINRATIVIQSYANSLYKAALLNEDLKAKMEEIITLSTVSSCKLNTDYNYTDTTKKKYRYQAVFELVY